MAKLTVKNIGPIREAELEVKKHTVFIGPQGTGKSTLAKLIAIGGDEGIAYIVTGSNSTLHNDYGVVGFIYDNSSWTFATELYKIQSSPLRPFFFILSKEGSNLIKTTGKTEEELEQSNKYYKLNNVELEDSNGKPKTYNSTYLVESIFENILVHVSAYIPAERILFPVIAGGIWSLLYAKISIPRPLVRFGDLFEQAYKIIAKLDIPFLNIKYHRAAEDNLVEYKAGAFVNLSLSASGYQSIIPLLLVVEHQRQQAKRRFIIEEPELNLYPTAQKDLIYSLVGGLDPEKTYQDAEWVITTHSPYVLTSYNTLMLAYKVAQKSEELRAEVEKIIPSRCWINPDEFAAYYVDNGTVESITNPDTGLINDSRLDDVSEDFAGEQDVLLNLYRSVLVND